MQQRGGQGVFPRGPAFAEGPSQAKRFKVEGQIDGHPRVGTPQSVLMQQQQQQPQQSYQNISCPPSLSSPSGVNVSDQELQVEISK